MMAAALNYTDVVQLLIKRGANTDLVNKVSWLTSSPSLPSFCYSARSLLYL
jgi:hypothetical protein